MSHAEIIGDLANEPIMEAGPNGPIASFTVITKEQEPGGAGGGLKKSSQYHRIAVFGRELAGFAKSNLRAGSAVHLEGNIRYYRAGGQSDRIAFEIHVGGPQAMLRPYRHQGRRVYLNRAELTGELSAGPAIRQGPNGPIVFFPVATTEPWDKGSLLQEETPCYPVAVFEPQLAKYASAHLKKGSLVRVWGAIHHQKYQTQIQVSGPQDALLINSRWRVLPGSVAV